MNLDDWVDRAPQAIRDDAIWKVRAFQIGSYIGAMASRDSLTLERQTRFAHVSFQLVRAAGSIPANVAEGYSRHSRRERIRFYEYALGSASEAKSWYTTAADALDQDTVEDRLTYLARVSQLLLRMIQNERQGLARNTTKRIV